MRPLFHPAPVQRSEKLSRALNKLTSELHQLLYEMGREPRHDQLAEWTFHPALEEMTIDLRLELASGSHLNRVFPFPKKLLPFRHFFVAKRPEF